MPKILLTADLHSDPVKHEWVKQAAISCDAVLLAGDILDLFCDITFAEQIDTAKNFRDSLLLSGVGVAWCSGNHDFPHNSNTSLDCFSPRWMRDDRRGNHIRDSESGLIEVRDLRLVVTTIPWCSPRSGKQKAYLSHVSTLIQQGRSLQKQHNAPWVILHHCPPDGTPLTAGEVSDTPELSREVERLIASARPTIAHYGHYHQAPFSQSGNWRCVIDDVESFNAGQSSRGDEPNAVIVDFETAPRTTQFYCFGENAVSYKNENIII